MLIEILGLEPINKCNFTKVIQHFLSGMQERTFDCEGEGNVSQAPLNEMKKSNSNDNVGLTHLTVFTSVTRQGYSS